MDTIADFLTRIRNASASKHDKLDVPSSNIRKGIAQILEDYGYIKSYRVVPDGKQGVMRVYLRYLNDGTSPLKTMRRISRPGKRVYVKSDEVPKVRSGYGLAILSTNKGVVSGEQATDLKVGGELLCKIW